jgi:tetratricopeptide (TPR) repeat protein
MSGLKFGWSSAKRQKMSVSQDVQNELKESLDADEERERSAYDEWLKHKNSAVLCLEDATTLSTRKQEEGQTLAEAGRFRDAISRWQQAIELTPGRAVLYELQAQCWMELGELFDAVRCAEQATMVDPMWPEAHLTLGRSRLNFGEIEMGLASLRRAAELAPNMDIAPDMEWAMELMGMKERLIQDAICTGNVLSTGPAAEVLAERPLLRMSVGGRVCLSVPLIDPAMARQGPGLSLRGLVPPRRPAVALAAGSAASRAQARPRVGWGDPSPPPSSSSSRTPSPPPS